MRKYSVSQLAKLAGITIRTLHYYDKIGLLKPAERADSRYRYYGKEELHRLQQIMFFRELDFSLKKIKEILDDPEFDRLEALRFQQKELEKRRSRTDTLIATINKTIQQITEDSEMVSDEELYEGFSKEEVEQMNKEVDEKYDPEIVEESRRNVKAMTKAEFKAVKEEQDAIPKELAELMDRAIDDPEVQALVKRHHQTNEQFYKTNANMYKGLADMYVSDPRFTEFYDKHRPGLAGFLRKAIHYYADHNL